MLFKFECMCVRIVRYETLTLSVFLALYSFAQVLLWETQVKVSPGIIFTVLFDTVETDVEMVLWEAELGDETFTVATGVKVLLQ